MHFFRLLALGAALIGTALGAAPAAAQLRPLSPFPWGALQDGRALTLRVGLGLHRDQRAALAGTRGELLEAGNFEAVWRSGRFALEFGGTVLRLFQDQSTFAPPATGSRPDAGPDRRDSGDYRIGTVIRLTPERLGATGVLRFGTRLPTTDNAVGLDRDRTDFYALLGGSARHGALRFGAEAGVGIHGTHDSRYEQHDVLLYSASAEYTRHRVVPHATLVGQHGDISGWIPRGTEPLSELRLGLRTQGTLGAELAWVHGLTEYSPSNGVLLGVVVRR